jgi:uncharacterized protein (TIGR03435 family)
MTARLGLTLLHFLWQGACIAALYAIARAWMRSAQARYALACMALTAVIAAPVVTFAISRGGDPSETRPAAVVVAKTHRSAPLAKDPALDPIPIVEARSFPGEITPWLVRIWLAGAMVLWLRLLLTWIAAGRMTFRQVRPAPPEWQQMLNRLRARIQVARPVKLLVSSLIQGPVVVGWLRPVVLIPVSALAGVPCEHIEALLAHELAHIRRHDYLINILQTIAEATLFYHPAVWWISRHIRLERENCCDDVAVSVTGDPLVYVLALTDLESLRSSHPATVLAADGGSLKHRIARLLGASSPAPVPGALVAMLILLLTAWVLFSQTSPTARFDAASIKLHPGDTPGITFATEPGRLIVVNNPVANLIGNAYGNHKLVGAPEWVESDRYDLEARAPGSPNDKQMMQMLQVLLAERFKLQLHPEQREEPVYHLVVAKGGLKLHRRTDQNCARADRTHPDEAPSNPCGNNHIFRNGNHIEWVVTNNDMQHMVGALGVNGHPVIDKTGVIGTFDLHVEFAETQPDSDASVDPSVPSIFAALDQLGLKLEPAKGPVDVLVIDHIERPTPN